MLMCQQESFYQVDLLNPAKIRITDREYWAQRRGQARLDKETKASSLPDQQPSKYETEKGFLRRIITDTLTDSSSIEEFQNKLFEKYGVVVHESRGRISYQLPDRKKPVRGRSLGTDFEKNFIETFIINRSRSYKSAPAPLPTPHSSHRKVSLMVCLEEGMPEHIQELGKLLPVYPSDEAGCRFLCVIQNATDQPLVGKEQAAEDIKCRMRDLVCFTDFLYGMGMEEVGFQHSQDKAQAVGRIRDQHFRKKGVGVSAGGTLYPRDTQDHRHGTVIF